MSILALDLGTKTGWASSVGPSGVWDFKVSSFDSAGRRFVEFKNTLRKVFRLYHVRLVVYEEVRAHSGVIAAQFYGSMVAILQTECIEHLIEYQGVPVGTIKKHATGKGNADKEAMIKAAVLKFKTVNMIDHNHADSLWILDYALNNILY